MEPVEFVFEVTEPVRISDRLLFPKDRLVVEVGREMYVVVPLTLNDGAVAGHLANGSLHPLTPRCSPASFALAVGLDPPALSETPCAPSSRSSLRRWGSRLRRARLAVLP